MTQWIRDHSLGLTFTLIVLMALVGTLLLGPDQWRLDTGRRGTAPVTAGFWGWWGFRVLSSFLANTAAILLLVIFSKWLFERGSAESKEPPEARHGS